MVFNPKTLFLLNPIPRSRLELLRIEGNETPAFDSTAGVESSTRESEPHIGEEQLEGQLGKKKLNAFRINGCVEFWVTITPAATPAPAAAAATEQATTEKEREEETLGEVLGCLEG